MPSWLMSSRRPTKGEMKAAPALAASNAWEGEKHRVTLTLVPPWLSARQALRPSHVSGTLTATFGAISASARPSESMVSASVAVTSALTGPDTMSQMLRITSKKSPPDLAISEGLVVTPSSSPVAERSSISAMSAVSTKNFMPPLRPRTVAQRRPLGSSGWTPSRE